MRDETGRFIGFASPRYTQVPDEVFDELLAELAGSELKVLLYVVRRTFGFKRDSDNISLSQMVGGITKKDGTILDRGTGLDKKSVVRAVKALVSRDILVKRRNSSLAHGFESTEYALNLRNNPLWQSATRPLEVKTSQALAERSHIQETVRQEKEVTLTEHVDNSEKLKEKELLGQILIVCRDLDSINYYRQVIKNYPCQVIFSVLSQVREAAALGRIRKNPGAMFVDLMKRQSQQPSILEHTDSKTALKQNWANGPTSSSASEAKQELQLTNELQPHSG